MEWTNTTWVDMAGGLEDAIGRALRTNLPRTAEDAAEGEAADGTATGDPADDLD